MTQHLFFGMAWSVLGVKIENNNIRIQTLKKSCSLSVFVLNTMIYTGEKVGKHSTSINKLRLLNQYTNHNLAEYINTVTVKIDPISLSMVSNTL